MRFRVLGSSGGSAPGRFVASYLINDEVAIDAGGLTAALELEAQERVRHVLLSHSHLDHHCGLPFLADNVFGRLDQPIQVRATKEVIDSLRKHVFNDIIWPDFTRLPGPDNPTLVLEPIPIGQPVHLGKVSVMAIPVHHLTPTVGFLIEDQDGDGVIYTSDTGPTDRVWEVASKHPRLKAIVTEVSFSSDAELIANASGHMTPRLLEKELQKLQSEVPVFLTHLKPAHRKRILAEVKTLKLPRVEILEQGREYEF